MLLKGLLWFVVVFHVGVILGNLAAVPMLIIFRPWYEALPLTSIVTIISCTRIECPLTRLENMVRDELGMPRIGGFIKHYLLTPMRQHWHNS